MSPALAGRRLIVFLDGVARPVVVLLPDGPLLVDDLEVVRRTLLDYVARCFVGTFRPEFFEIRPREGER